MPPVAAIAIGAMAGGATLGGVAIGGGYALTAAGGALLGAGLGYAGSAAYSGIRRRPGVPGIAEIPEPPKPTVSEIEGFEAGWEEVLKKAKGRRGTILTEPMLAQVAPFTQRATLLSGL